MVVQDEVNALAMVDARGHVTPLLLPRGVDGHRAFDDGRGNKHHKLDLEAAVVLPDGRLVAFGSGSMPVRETLVVVGPDERPVLVDGSSWYAMLRAEPAFSGSELNIEGAVVRASELLLFQRGNGAPRGQLKPVDAVGAFELGAFAAWLDGRAGAPVLRWVMQADLGRIGDTRVSFTDAAVTQDGRLIVLACAEDSPDAVRDGPVLGCRVGFLEDDRLVMTDVLDEHGRPCDLKLEGIEHRPGTVLDFDVVSDMDDPAEPARLGRLRMSVTG